MIRDDAPFGTLRQPGEIEAFARGHLFLASIAFGGGMPCLGQKYLGEAVSACQDAAAADRLLRSGTELVVRDPRVRA